MLLQPPVRPPTSFVPRSWGVLRQGATPPRPDLTVRDPAIPSPAEPSLSGLLAFWAEAGVDLAYADAPQDRLADGRRASAPRPPPPPTPPPVGRPPPAEAKAADGVADPQRLAMAKAAAAGAGDLPALEAAIAAFPWTLGSAARRTVFARGAAEADVVIVGEAPGAEEDQAGAPFVGRSGRLLDRMLGAAGLLDRVFVTNTIFWRPPANRTPSQAEQALCRPFVDRAIALVRPRVLVLAGGASAKSMLGREEGILSLRGRWFDWRPESDGDDPQAPIPALPMLHPAFLLRQPAAKKRAWLDILTLVSRLDPKA